MKVTGHCHKTTIKDQIRPRQFNKQFYKRPSDWCLHRVSSGEAWSKSGLGHNSSSFIFSLIYFSLTKNKAKKNIKYKIYNWVIILPMSGWTCDLDPKINTLSPLFDRLHISLCLSIRPPTPNSCVWQSLVYLLYHYSNNTKLIDFWWQLKNLPPSKIIYQNDKTSNEVVKFSRPLVLIKQFAVKLLYLCQYLRYIVPGHTSQENSPSSPGPNISGHIQKAQC